MKNRTTRIVFGIVLCSLSILVLLSSTASAYGTQSDTVTISPGAESMVPLGYIYSYDEIDLVVDTTQPVDVELFVTYSASGGTRTVYLIDDTVSGNESFSFILDDSGSYYLRFTNNGAVSLTVDYTLEITEEDYMTGGLWAIMLFSVCFTLALVILIMVIMIAFYGLIFYVIYRALKSSKSSPPPAGYYPPPQPGYGYPPYQNQYASGPAPVYPQPQQAKTEKPRKKKKAQ